jgi:hypothetical protein
VRKLLEKPIQIAEKRIADRLPSLIDNLLVLADGVRVSKTTSEGDEVVYRQPPDRAANEYLINRVMGKPTDKTEAEVSVTGGVTIFLPERKAE